MNLNFEVNMEKYPGTIVDNTFVFDELKYKNLSSKIRVFRLFVRLVKEKRELVNVNWNVLVDNPLPLKPAMLEGDLQSCYSQYWSEYGDLDGKITRSAPKYPEEKNVGKKNKRNVLAQALETAHSLYKKKRKESVVSDIPQDAANPMMHPMLADTKAGPVAYPVYGQAKLDGNRCLAFINHKKDVVLYTRGQKLWPASPALLRVKEALLPILQKLQQKDKSIYMDGELYVHGLSLQNISKMRSESYDGPVSYYIFDCFYLDVPTPFVDRWRLLEAAGVGGLRRVSGLLELVKTKLLEDEKQEDVFYKECLRDGYEGIMLRTLDGKYAYSKNKSSKRSSSLLKRKPLFDEEFEVIGFVDGKKGKDVGAVIWVCKTASGSTFNVEPKLPYAERREIYLECVRNFGGKYRGRNMKVEYRELSDAGIPLRAKAIAFRDFD